MLQGNSQKKEEKKPGKIRTIVDDKETIPRNFVLLKSENRLLTPEYAAEIKEKNQYFAQRPLKERRVQNIMNIITKGLWVDLQLIAFGVMNDNEILVNGQHTCEAIIRLGLSIRMNFAWYDVKKAIELSDLYEQFDSILPRSVVDILRPQVHALAYGWQCPKIAQLVVMGVAFAEKKTTLSKHEKMMLLRSNRQFGDFVNDILVPEGIAKIPREYGHVARQSVVAAMKLTWEVNPDHARIFWQQVRDGVGEGMAVESPSKIAYDWLRSTQYIQGRLMNASGKRQMTIKEVIGSCLKAWNADRKQISNPRLTFNPDSNWPRIER